MHSPPFTGARQALGTLVSFTVGENYNLLIINILFWVSDYPMGANEHCKVLFKDDIKCVSKRAFAANPFTGGRQAMNTCELHSW